MGLIAQGSRNSAIGSREVGGEEPDAGIDAEPRAIQSYKDLRVWQAAMDLAEMCYRLAAQLPRDELYGLTSQVRRSAVSVPANIAEGYGRENLGSYIQFLKVAQGSLKELETHIILSERVGIAHVEVTSPILARCDAVGRMLNGLIRSLQRQRPKDFE